MENYVLLAVVGKTDPIRGMHDGPILHIIRNYHPEKVYLILTDEIKTKEMEYHYNQQAINMLEPECQVEVIETDIKDAHSYDAFATIFLQICAAIKGRHPERRIILNITSGTPQMETALCMIGISDPHTYLPVQVAAPENSSTRSLMFDPQKDLVEEWFETNLDNEPGSKCRCMIPQLLNFKRPIIQFQIRSLIENYDYAGAYQLLMENQEMFSARACKLLLHAKKRINLEREDAKKLAAELNLDKELNPVRREDIGRLIDFYNSMKIKQFRGELNDFAMRLEVMTEYLGIYILENCMHISLSDICNEQNRKNSRIYFLTQSKAETKIPGIGKYLDQQFADTKAGAFIWGSPLNAKSIIYIVAFLSNKDKFQKYESAAKEMLRWSELSTQIRNPAAHTIITITEELIKDSYGKDSSALCKMMKTVLRQAFGTEANEAAFAIYEMINERIIAALEE